MKNDWSNLEAKKYINKYQKLGHSRDMALRVYTTRLLGRNSELVLHGGGNTSVKTSIKILMAKIMMSYVLKEVDGIWLKLNQQVYQQ